MSRQDWRSLEEEEREEEEVGEIRKRFWLLERPLSLNRGS